MSLLVLPVLCSRVLIRVPSGEELAAGFQRIPNRRVLPDYFEVISEPTAFSTVRVSTQMYDDLRLPCTHSRLGQTATKAIQSLRRIRQRCLTNLP